MTGPGPDRGELMTAGQIAQALSVRGQTVTNWVRRWPEFPAAVRAGGQTVYALVEVVGCLDRHRIPGKRLQAGEASETTYGQRLRRVLALPSRPIVDHGSTTPARARRERKPRPTHSPAVATPEDSWAEMLKVLKGGNQSAKQDLVVALLWLRFSDSSRWLQSARNGYHDLLSALQECWGETISHLSDPPPLPLDSFSGSWRPDRIREMAKRLDLKLRDSKRTLDAGHLGKSLPATVFDVLMDRLAQDRHDHLGIYLTPADVVQIMVELADPQPGERVVDPCCGYGDLLVTAGSYTGPGSDVSLYGLAQDERAWRVTTMNAAIHALPIQVEPGSETLLNSFPSQGVQGDVILTNPPFATTDWSAEDPADQPGWPYGPPPRHSSTFAWLQVVFAGLTASGRAVVVMPRGASDPTHERERAIMRDMIEDGVIRGVIELPANLFRETSVPVSLWVLGPRRSGPHRGVLLIDGASEVTQQTSAHRVLTASGRDRIVKAWREWSACGGTGEPGFSVVPTIEQIRDQNYALASRRYLEPTSSARRHLVPGVASADLPSLAELHRELARLQTQATELDAALDDYLTRLVRSASQ